MIWLGFLLITTLSVTDASSSNCPAVCHCEQQERSAVCGKTKHGLTYIPTVPDYVKNFKLVNGKLPVINRTMLLGLSKLGLLSLTLNSDNIQRLSADTFTDFQELETLDLSGNNIHIDTLMSAFKILGNHLNHVVLHSMNISDIPPNLFPTNISCNIITINLSHNRLKIFNESLFAVMSNLQNIDVSNNEINSVIAGQTYIFSITHLNMADNMLEHVPAFCLPNGSSKYPQLKQINLDGNKIQTINNLSFVCLDKMKNVSLNNNLITVLAKNTFSSLPHLYKLQLMSLKLKTIEELAFKSKTLKILFLSSNHRLESKVFTGDFPFKWAPRLSVLNLQRTRLSDLPLTSLRAMLLQLKSIRYLNLQKTWLYELPVDTFGQLPHLSRLDLQGNYLPRWDDRTFSNMTQLKYLNLDGCRISVINETSFPVEVRTSIKEINLGNNHFLCSCGLLWFRTWMNDVIKNKSIKFINYPQKYFCKNLNRIHLDKYNPTYSSCHNLSPYIIASIGVGCFAVVILVIFTVVYRNRWNIRYCMYSRRRRHYQQIQQRDVQIKYDAFVSFDSYDLDWTMTEVCSFLENELQLKLCIHRRDFKAAKLIIDNIMDCMEQSEKIILIISNHFAKSAWCQCEVQLALDEHFKNQKDVIIVVREMIERKLMFKSLKALMSCITYIEWEDDSTAKKVFIQSLASAMGCQLNNV